MEENDSPDGTIPNEVKLTSDDDTKGYTCGQDINKDSIQINGPFTDITTQSDEHIGASYDDEINNSAASYGPEEANGASKSTTQLVSCDPFTKDVYDTHAVAGQSGLYNLGNTCFMNSGLQSMLSTTPLLKYFLDKYMEVEEINSDSTLAVHFIYLACKYWSGRFSIIHPREFKSALGLQHSQFQDYRQHDCQEFLALLLDTLHEQAIKLDQLEPREELHQLGYQNSDETDGIEQELNNSTRSISDSADESHHEDGESDASERDQSYCRLDWKHVTLPNNKSGNKEACKSPCKQTEDSFLHIAHTENIHKPEIPPLQSDSFESQAEQYVRNLPSVLNNAVNLKQKIPLFEQFYSKDTKTLNTNMLINEYTEDPLAVDSEKFSKPDNISVQDNSSDINLTSIPNEPTHMNVEVVKDGPVGKGLKDTNIWADKKNRLSKMCPDELYSDDRSEDGDSIKRMRFEKTEKNLQQQELSKFNKSVFQISNQGDCHHGNIDTCITVNDTSDASCKLQDEYQDNSDDETASVNEISEDFAGLQQCDEEVLEADIEAAEKAWEAYIKQHKQSIIVDTFQGQFKSTVICSACTHVSVTYEPFMYLSVPLPHATDRQMSVIYVSCDGLPIQYLLTMNKNDKILKVKQEVKGLVQSNADDENCDMVMTEVLDSHISRILEDNVMLRYVNDSTRKIYAFQIKPCKLEDIPQETSDNKSSPSAPSNDVFTDMGMFSVTDLPKKTCNQDFVTECNHTIIDADSGSNVEAPLVTGIESCKILPESMVHMPTNEQDFHNDVDCTNNFAVNQTTDQSQENVCLSDVYMQDAECDISRNSQSNQWSEDNGGHFGSSLTASWEWTCEEKQEPNFSSPPQWEATVETSNCLGNSVDMTSSTISVTMVDQWKSCAICLEELSDPELLVHTNCKGTFCQSCLEMSFKHYGSEIFCCPVCSTPAVMTEDFLPLTDNCDQPTQMRVILVDVSFLLENDGPKERHLIGHPRLLYLPSHMEGWKLFQYLDPVIPIQQEYVVRYTDGQGLRCSRCQYTSHCPGCIIPREGEVTLRPGDHITVCYGDISLDVLETAVRYECDKSMDNLRPDKPLSIYDCIRAFTDSEILDEQNPWFCPSCQLNQCARKTMTVWQYPDTLIVHLKRFMYHDLSSTKVDCQVIFPLENLDLSQFISGPTTNTLQYDLYSIICHFGGASAGHYTAFTKHPLDGNWYYYNDENVTKQAPSHADYSNAYILFYQRQGTEVDFDVTSKLKTLNMDKLPALCQSQTYSMNTQIEEKPEIPALA